MAGYSPLKITGMSTGLVQQREEFILPDDAYPQLQNAYVWRERILRKKGYQLLGRLQRNIGTTDGAGNLVVVIAPLPIQPGIASFTVGTNLFNDPGGASPVVLLTSGPGTATLNRATGTLTIAGSNPNAAVQYYPGLPVMGIRTRELTRSTNEETIFFDQNYAYVYDQTITSFRKFLPLSATTWNASAQTVSGVDFFWSTNYWVSAQNLPDTIPPSALVPFFSTADLKLFWVTNNTGDKAAPDPIRITDGTTWVDFRPPNFGQIDTTHWLVGCLSLLPFRGRMLAFNTWEGGNAGGSIAAGVNYSNRIRWSTIGNPFIRYEVGPPARGSWRDDIRGQGGFLDIPTSEDIVSVGFVRDNLVIYCERSTWQLRYTGRSIAPFQIEKVNSELGGEGPFSAVQFDTSLVGIGDKGIVECDSYKSERIDIKIPDFVFQFQDTNNGRYRVHGMRDFINRLAFWTIPLSSQYQAEIGATNKIFPNTRLIYNYENDSWALFNDSLTAMGTYQPQTGRTWLTTKTPWIRCDFPWISTQQQGVPDIVGGNQQGFVEYLDELTTNDVSLYISNITPNTLTPTVITSPNHNMNTDFVIEISGIPVGSPYAASLNGGIFGIIVTGANTFELWKYDPDTREFSTPQLDVPAGDYVGGGLIKIRENFSVVSKKFNFLDDGQNIQMGYLDILMSATERNQPGAISLFVYLNYDGDSVSNTTPQNEINDYSPVKNPDTFFNSVIPTTQSTLSGVEGSKFWQRVYCATQANFLTLEFTFSNGQMAGEEQTKNVQIDAQVLWIRKSGRLSST